MAGISDRITTRKLVGKAAKFVVVIGNFLPQRGGTERLAVGKESFRRWELEFARVFFGAMRNVTTGGQTIGQE